MQICAATAIVHCVRSSASSTCHRAEPPCSCLSVSLRVPPRTFFQVLRAFRACCTFLQQWQNILHTQENGMFLYGLDLIGLVAAFAAAAILFCRGDGRAGGRHRPAALSSTQGAILFGRCGALGGEQISTAHAAFTCWPARLGVLV